MASAGLQGSAEMHFFSPRLLSAPSVSFELSTFFTLEIAIEAFCKVW